MTVYAPTMPEAGAQGGWLSLFRFSTRVLQGDELDAFRNRPLVVLSPHFHDACCSLGAFLAHLSCGHLVNVFTQDGPIAGEAAAYDIQDREDAAFAARCRLTRHDLGCEAPDRRGRRAHDLSGIADDRTQIGRPVLSCLGKIALAFPAGQRGILLCPLGTGRHVNRRALAALVADELPRLQHFFDVYFYEELPHASRPLAREAALRRLRRTVTLSARYAFPARWWSKRELLQLYPSLFRGFPRPTRFNPAALFPAFPHEAFWSASPRKIA
jgi:hypothetical protein